MSLRKDITEQTRAFVKEAYMITNQFPMQDKYSSADQLRRAALSISLNIREGYSRYSISSGKKELLRFLTIAYSSCEECQEIITIFSEMDTYANIDFNNINNELIILSKKLRTLLNLLKADLEQC